MSSQNLQDDSEAQRRHGSTSEQESHFLRANTAGSSSINNNNRNYNNYTEIDFDGVRAIPGGRYGCAQFVKICGPPTLKNCSLGKLNQLVQYAVKEDVLRYHKTLLVWTTKVDKHKKMAEMM